MFLTLRDVVNVSILTRGVRRGCRVGVGMFEYGRIWFGRIWSNLVKFGRIWSNLVEYGRICSNF